MAIKIGSRENQPVAMAEMAERRGEARERIRNLATTSTRQEKDVVRNTNTVVYCRYINKKSG
jgi:hypothetical protein